jgi:hypothetical protein
MGRFRVPDLDITAAGQMRHSAGRRCLSNGPTVTRSSTRVRRPVYRFEAPFSG